MGFDQPKQSSSSGAAVVVVATVILATICGLLAVAGAGWFWMRAARMETLELVWAEEHRAVAQQRLAQAEAARAKVELQRAVSQLERAATQIQQASPEATPDPRLDFEVTLDREGTASIDGEGIGLGELRARLETLKEVTSNAFSVRINADPECPVRLFIPVLDVCNDVGDIDFRVASRGGPESADEGAVDK